MILFGFAFFIVKKHSNRRRISVIVLSGAYGPEKSHQKTTCYQYAEYDQDNNYSHSSFNRFAIKRTENVANATTLMLLNGISIAANKGVI